MGKTIDKLPIETTEHDSAIKRKEQVIQAMVLVNLKNIILSEKADTEEHILYDSSYIKF